MFPGETAEESARAHDYKIGESFHPSEAVDFAGALEVRPVGLRPGATETNHKEMEVTDMSNKKSERVTWKAWDPMVFHTKSGARLVIGGFYDINGEGSVEHEAKVSIFEMELLCKHWAEEILGCRRMTEVYECTGSREIRAKYYASSRLDYFETILGEEKVEALLSQVFEGFDPQKERIEFWASQQEHDAGEPALEGEQRANENPESDALIDAPPTCGASGADPEPDHDLSPPTQLLR